MGNASSSDRSTTLSRDTYFFITEDVQDRLRLAEKRQLSLSSSSGEEAAVSPRRGAPTLSDSVADSIRQTQLLDRLQQEYEERLAKLEDRSQRRFQSAAEQFSSAVNQVEAKFVDLGALPPCCQAERLAMARCYAANARFPLRCSQVVTAFERCVTEQRRAFVQRQPTKPSSQVAAETA